MVDWSSGMIRALGDHNCARSWVQSPDQPFLTREITIRSL